MALLAQLRADWDSPATPIVISGNLGPRGDGYRAGMRMSAAAAHDYNLAQIATFAGTEADMVSAFTITYPDEAIGVRANASRRSHAELDESTELDDGDPEDLGEQYLALHHILPRMNVVGGCCGTDERHVDAMARHLTGRPPRNVA